MCDKPKPPSEEKRTPPWKDTPAIVFRSYGRPRDLGYAQEDMSDVIGHIREVALALPNDDTFVPLRVGIVVWLGIMEEGVKIAQQIWDGWPGGEDTK